MIGKLRGTVDAVENDCCILDVGGVGYVAYCPSSTLASLTPGQENVVLLIETVVREDLIRLYGFSSAVEREWFRVLQAHVQGVGAKMALALLSVLSPSQLAAAVSAKDAAAVARAQGVGKKLAERIVSELQGKVPAGSMETAAFLAVPQGTSAEDAIAALANLGFDRTKATAAVYEAAKNAGEGADTASLISIGLKLVSRI